MVTFHCVQLSENDAYSIGLEDLRSTGEQPALGAEGRGQRAVL